MPSLGAYLVIGACAAVATFVATPIVGWFARRMGWLYHPNDRTVHTEPVPAIGGLALFFGFLTAMGVARLWDSFDPLFARNSEPRGVVIAACIVFAVGFIDDVHPLAAPTRVTATVLGGMVLVWFGVTMYYFRLPYLDVLYIADDWVPLVTVLWLLGMTQAINLIDGLDGLAAGIVAIAAGAFFLYADRLDDADLLTPPNLGPLMAIIACGVCVGFLPHNFNPARIFMGDGGALMLGGLMAAATMLVGGQTSTEVSGQVFFFFAPLFIPFFVMGVPIFDTIFAIFRRARQRRSMSEADKDHLHHRLMRLGHGHRRSVVILWLWTGLLAVFVLYPVYTGNGDAVVPIALAALALALLTFFFPNVRRVRREDEAVDAPDQDATV